MDLGVLVKMVDWDKLKKKLIRCILTFNESLYITKIINDRDECVFVISLRPIQEFFRESWNITMQEAVIANDL